MTTHNMECAYSVLQNKILNLSALHAKQNIFSRGKKKETEKLDRISTITEKHST